MQKVRFLAAVSFLAALFVAALTWAWWPRPIVHRLNNVSPNVPALLVNLPNRTERPQTLIRFHDEADVLRIADGDTVTTSVKLPFETLVLGCEADGSTLVQNLCSSGFDCEYGFRMTRKGRIAVRSEAPSLYRYDWATGSCRLILKLDEPKLAATTISKNLSVFAAAYSDERMPLTIRLFDLPNGSLRQELTFPNRFGDVNFKSDRVAAYSWQLSDDGSKLFLAEGWNGIERTTPRGIEAYDTTTGSRIHCIDYDDRIADPTPIAGMPIEAVTSVRVCGLLYWIPKFNAVSFSVSRRLKHMNTPDWGIFGGSEYQVGFSADGKLGPVKPTLFGFGISALSSPDAGLRVSMDRNAGTIEVYDEERLLFQSERSQWILDLNRNSGPGPGPGSDSFFGDDGIVLYTRRPSEALPEGFVQVALNRLGWKSSFTPNRKYILYDWRIDRASEIRFTHHDCELTTLQHAKHGDRILFVHFKLDETHATLELYQLFPTKPWRWSIPAGILSSLLACSAFVMQRRKRRLRRITT